jgi:hypothetical protein
MFGKSLRAKLVVLSIALAPVSGCQIAGDLIDPAFLSAFGFDPETVALPQGRVIVAFNNTSRSDAEFFVTSASTDLTSTQQASAEVGAGESGNAVFDCPIGLIFPGTVDGQTVGPAVAVATAMGVVAVPYTGVPIESGRDFQCGDVIEVRLEQIGQGAAAGDFAIRVTIRAGR